MDKIRINLANPQELLAIPGIDQARSETILRHRAQKGPITDAAELAATLGPGVVTPALLARIDFEPAETTAPEAPGA
jgi:DNA uptake protein ComE-like DNA-binding protein